LFLCIPTSIAPLVSLFHPAPESIPSSHMALMLESAGSSEILEHFYLTTCCLIPKGNNLKTVWAGIVSTSLAFVWNVMKIGDLGQKLKEKCYQRFILSFILFVIYVQSHAASDCSGLSNIMPSPLQPGQSLICCIKFIIESFIYEETKVPLPLTHVSPPDTYLSGPLDKNVVRNSLPRILQCLQENMTLELRSIQHDLVWRIFDNLYHQLEMCLE
jgi:hypothetical protein